MDLFGLASKVAFLENEYKALMKTNDHLTGMIQRLEVRLREHESRRTHGHKVPASTSDSPKRTEA